MRWFLLLSVLLIALFACNKSSDRKLRLVKIDYNGSRFPTMFEYDAQGQLRETYIDYKDLTDAGYSLQFFFDNSRLKEIIRSDVSIAGLAQTIDKFEYHEDGRIKSIKEELVKGRPEILMRYEFGYIGSSRLFDSCKLYRTFLGTESPYQLYTFTRDGDGNILSQSTWSPDQDNWVLNHKEEFSYGHVDNPEYMLASPVSFINYYSKKICTKIVRYNWDGTVLLQRNFKARRISPLQILVKEENGEGIYYDLN